MATAIAIPDQLFPRIFAAAKKKDFTQADKFAAHLIAEKLFEMEEQEKIFANTDKVRTALEAKGISEEETLADFERARGSRTCALTVF